MGVICLHGLSAWAANSSALPEALIRVKTASGPDPPASQKTASGPDPSQKSESKDLLNRLQFDV
jgi:hypothetical protein